LRSDEAYRADGPSELIVKGAYGAFTGGLTSLGSGQAATVEPSGRTQVCAKLHVRSS